MGAAMARTVTTAALLALCWSGAAGAEIPDATGEPDVIGQAFERGSDRLLYEEHHFCNEDTTLCQVFYLNATGDLFARKDIEYQKAPAAPGLLFQDFRKDLEIRIDPSEDSELVVDAGFDNYVRQRWLELSGGESIRFPFLIAGRDRPLAMRAGPDKDDDCEESNVCLEIELDSWLLGMIVDPIELTYDRDTRRLLRFQGISNLKDDEGGSQQVDIRYQYPQPPANTSDADESPNPSPEP